MPAPKQRHELLQKRLKQFTRMLHGLDEGDVRALHRTRIASRRLREVLPILQLDAKVARKLNRRLRKVTRRLGTLRDLDVLLLLIAGLQESGRHDEQVLSGLATAVSDERAEERERLFTKLPTAELSRIADKLDKIVRGLKANKDSPAARGRHSTRGCRWVVEARLTRRASELATAVDAAGAVYLPERLHAVRIALKKLRYAVEVSTEIAAAPAASATSDLRALKHGQDVLGRLHDVQVLIDRVRHLQTPSAPLDLTTRRTFDALVASLENDCRRLHARYMRARSALLAICDRVGVRPLTSVVRQRAG